MTIHTHRSVFARKLHITAKGRGGFWRGRVSLCEGQIVFGSREKKNPTNKCGQDFHSRTLFYKCVSMFYSAHGKIGSMRAMHVLVNGRRGRRGQKKLCELSKKHSFSRTHGNGGLDVTTTGQTHRTKVIYSKHIVSHIPKHSSMTFLLYLF